jgi:hypothetical protein
VGDATGDALYPVWPRSGAGAGSNIPQLDLTGSRIEWDGTNIKVHISAADLSNLASPDTTNQTHVWWLTTWQENSKIFFAKAESDGGGALTFTAGAPATYDRPGLTYYTIPTLVDYRGGTSVNGVKNGNEFVVTVPPNLVGNVGAGAVLQSVTGYSVLDNGSPPIVTVGATGAPEDNMPTIADATPAYNAVLAASTSTSPPVTPIAAPSALPNTAAVVLQLPAPLRVGLGGLLVALAIVGLIARGALGRQD